jgi:hypothetical protein
MKKVTFQFMTALLLMSSISAFSGTLVDITGKQVVDIVGKPVLTV